MKKTDYSSGDYLKLIEMMKQDEGCVHFLWCCSERRVLPIGDVFIPEDCSNPLDYLRESGMVNNTSMGAFNVFCAQIEEGIFSGSTVNNLNVELQMNLCESAETSMYHLFALFLRNDSQKITDIHFCIRPCSEKEAFAKQVLNLFSSDKNPKFFQQRINNMLARNRNRKIGFVQFDVERFKLINENLGSEAGDELLQFLNDSLGLICNSEQPFCRLTADVFMVVTPFDDTNELVSFVHMLESKLSDYNGIEYRLIFGICTTENIEGMNTRQMGDHATLARQSIKGNALENIAFYNGDMKTTLQKKKVIEDDMHKALINNEFVMFLQPKHCISNGRIIGAEALARWIHPEKGMISPIDFIPVFEENGFILKLDQVIWESACRKIREWIDKGIEPVPISVNVSREYLHNFDVVNQLLSYIKKYDIPIKLLELEITESIDAEGVDDIVKCMKDAGFTMLMDDFGSGYSSLNMLKTTQFDVLKIDRSFLSEFMDSDRGRKIISHTISMSHDIGLDIIAEGVETSEQAQFLNDCGCNSAQGYFYSKPIPPEDFDRKLIEVNK